MHDSDNAFDTSTSSFGKKSFSNSPLSVKYVRSKTEVPAGIDSCWKNFWEYKKLPEKDEL